jgi:hypothetical protein
MDEHRYNNWNIFFSLGGVSSSYTQKYLNKNRVLFDEKTCSVECAPGCTAEMRDDDLCQEECENTNCCYNYGACAREAKKKSLSARWAVIAGDGVSVKPVLESLCNQESYNPEANATGVAACEMLARYSFPAGWCAPGYCRFPSQHMFNPITESYLSGSSF